MASGSTDPKQLDEAGTVLPARNFFWDSVILYLGSSILALTGFDALSEYIRGSGVSCIDSEGQDPGGYITSYCGDSLPTTQYLPAFLYLHALAIIVPHFVFNATFGGEFDYFFSVARNLKTDNGKFSKTNISIVRRLTSSFTVTRTVTTYGKNSIYLIYLGKLLLQLLFAIGSLTVSFIYFTDFNVSLQCPKDETKLNTTAFPPAKQVTCVYNSLKLLYYLRIVDLSLIVLICSAVFRGLWYCISSHPFRLQPEKVAKFAYQSSIHPDRHSDNCGLFCQKHLCCCRLYSPFGLPRIFVSPMIASDLDFLVLKLFRTNAGIGKLFRDIQIELEVRDEFDQERMTLKLHKYKFNSHFKGMDIPDCDLKWRFTSKTKPTATCPHDIAKSTFLSPTVPNTIRGTIFGLSYYAPNSLGALVMTFNSCGYGLALQRRFMKVSSIEFTNARVMEADVVSTNTSNPNLKLKDLVKFVKATSTNTEVVVSEKALVSIELETKDSNPKLKNLVKFVKTTSTDTDVVVSENALVEIETKDVIEYLSPLWKYGTGSLKTSFLVIGPMNEKQAHLMSLVLTQMSSTRKFLEDNCLIVTMVPKRIGTAQISRGYFKGLNKTPHNCTEATVCLNTSRTPLTWPPSTEQQSPNPNNLEEEESDLADLERSGLLNETSLLYHDSQNKVNLLCGETDVEFEIHTYRFKYEDTIDETMTQPQSKAEYSTDED